MPFRRGPPLFSVSTNASLVAMRPATLASGLAKIDQVPSGYVKIAIENGPFVVDFPIKHGGFP